MAIRIIFKDFMRMHTFCRISSALHYTTNGLFLKWKNIPYVKKRRAGKRRSSFGLLLLQRALVFRMALVAK